MVPGATKHTKEHNGDAEPVERLRRDLGRGLAGPTTVVNQMTDPECTCQ